MSNLMQPYAILLFSAAVLSAVMVLSAVRMRPNLGTRSFSVLMGAVSLWALLSLFEVISRDLQAKVFSHSFKYLFIVIVPIAWLSFGLYYANRLRSWRMGYLLPLLLIPLVTLILVATNGAHSLMFTSLEWHNYNKGQLIFRNFGPWFWVHTAYSYILLLIGFFSLAKSLIDSPRPFRRQLISLLIGGLTPWACNMLFIFKEQPQPYLDLTPFAFSISGLAILWGIMRYRLLDLVPIAHGFVIQHLYDGIIVLDEERRILDLNPEAARLMKARAEDLIGRPADQVITWWPAIDCFQSKNKADDRLITQVDLDDGKRWIQISKAPLTRNGRPMGHLVVLVNITAIKNTEEALRLSEDRFKSLAENAPILIFSLNEVGMLTYVNPAWTQILGYPRHAVAGQSFGRYVADPHRSPHSEIFNLLISGQKSCAAMTLDMVHNDGSNRIFDLTAAVNSDAEGRITGIIGLAKDITEETKLQEQLLMAQKMEAIGTLAGGIAHDFNNLLMGIQANVSLMRLETSPEHPLQDKLNRVEDQIQSGASLTRQLLGYARKGKYSIHTIDVRRLIEDTLHVVSRTHKQIQIHKQISADQLLMEADRGQIELVLLNLFVNAVDAMPDGGDLFLNAGLVEGRNLDALRTDLRPGCYIKIEIIDTGVGMDDQTKDRIFEPFFTTKEIGRGTGLGLASVYGVVKNHDGHIQAESSRGKGTTFTILFPASANIQCSEKTSAAHLEPEVPLMPIGTILIVDDEPSILEFSGEMIESLGYHVLRAESGEEALRIYENRWADIELVILDMIMPVMDGIGVFQALKAINPDVRVILASGYGLNKRAEQILSEGSHGNLKKPYTRNELADVIAQVRRSIDSELLN